MQNRRDFLKLLGTGAAGALALSTPLSVFAADDFKRLTILHTNDFHSHIDPFGHDVPRNAGEGGMAKRAALIKKIRSESKNVLLFDAGDIYQGTPYFNYFKAQLDFELMTMMGYDAATLGNHEFDNGLEGIKSQLKFAGFPFINSNYDFSDTILAGYDTGWIDNPLQNFQDRWYKSRCLRTWGGTPGIGRSKKLWQYEV